MKHFILVLLLTTLPVLSRDITPGRAHFILHTSVGWQLNSISFNVPDSLSFYNYNPDSDTDSLIGSTPTFAIPSAPLLTIKAGAQIKSQQLSLSLATAFPKTVSTHLSISPLYRVTFAYQYTFFNAAALHPHLAAGVGFHRYTIHKGFFGNEENSASDITYTGKHYQLALGGAYRIRSNISLASEVIYRWVHYQNIGIAGDTSYPTNFWGGELSLSSGLLFVF